MQRKKLVESLARKVKEFVNDTSLTEDVQKSYYETLMEYRIAKNDFASELTLTDLERAEFYTHYKHWRESTMLYQSIDKILDSSHYRAIINMGKRAVPYILEQIQERPDMVVFALRKILGFTVIPKNRKIVPVDEQCRMWINYFKKNKTVLTTEFAS